MYFVETLVVEPPYDQIKFNRDFLFSILSQSDLTTSSIIIKDYYQVYENIISGDGLVSAHAQFTSVR